MTTIIVVQCICNLFRYKDHFFLFIFDFYGLNRFFGLVIRRVCVVRSLKRIVHMLLLICFCWYFRFIIVGVVRAALRLSTSVGLFVGQFGQSSR